MFLPRLLYINQLIVDISHVYRKYRLQSHWEIVCVPHKSSKYCAGIQVAQPTAWKVNYSSKYIHFHGILLYFRKCTPMTTATAASLSSSQSDFGFIRASLKYLRLINALQPEDFFIDIKLTSKSKFKFRMHLAK